LSSPGLFGATAELFISHPLTLLLVVPTAVYLTFISARGISRNTKHRNEKIGVEVPNKVRDDELLLAGIVALFLVFVVPMFLLLTYIGSVLPFKIGL
jgi:hypothetical protein